MEDWIALFKAVKGRRGVPMAQEMITLFATAAGVEPELDEYPDLAAALLFGPLVPSQFRLRGHGKRSDAKEVFLRSNACAVNALSELSEGQIGQLRVVSGLLPANGPLKRLVGKI